MGQLLDVAKAYLAAKHFRTFRSRAQLERWQQRRAIHLLQQVLPRSPFTRERLGERRLHEWRAIEPIDKHTMMARFDDLNTRGLARDEAFEVALRAEKTRDFSSAIGDLTVGLSSGTSGARGLFVASAAERAAWAGCMLARALPGSLLGSHRIALFLRAGSTLYDTLGTGRISFSFYDLLEPLESHLQRLEEYCPTVLTAPPSMLRALAEAQHRRALRIVPLRVISVAEVLDPVDQRVIERAFEQPVHQIYQCTEGFLGVTCAHGALHLNEDLAVIDREYLDRALGKFVPIVTDLWRVTQPIVRYRLDDILTERRTPCPCGSVMAPIEVIEGRCDDVFYLPPSDGRDPIVVFPDFMRRAIITSSEAITAYVVKQLSPHHVQVDLTVSGPRKPAETAARNAIVQLCDRLGAQTPRLTFGEGEVSPGIRKLKRVERCFTPGPQRAVA